MSNRFSLRSALSLLVWLLSATAVTFLASVPTSLPVQAVLSILAVAAVLILRHYVAARGLRMLFLGIAGLVVLRYWFWRVFNTLPGLDDPVSFGASLAMLVVETYAIGVFFLGSFVMADPVRRRPAPQLAPEDAPAVDVLIPSLDEPTSMLAITLSAARNMRYPADKLTVVLCDDGGTDQRCNDPDPDKAAVARARRRDLRALCDRLGVVYKTRPANISAKAGNLNEALDVLTGDLVAIFDADHAPTPDFLQRTVGYFSRHERLFLVQTPHFFLNDDPVARNLCLGEDTPPENEMFYRDLNQGLDRWGATFFCGSAAVLRREALDEVGGISGKTITEDAETALKIHARGWHSLYVNRAMIAGLQPETFASLLQQRGRWATGMIQLLMTSNPFFKRGLGLFQRLCYFNSMGYWLFPLFRMVLLLGPLAYLFFSIELFVTTAEEALAYIGGYIAVTYIVQNALFGSSRHPFVSEIYEVAQTPYLLRAVMGAIIRPRGAKFKVTSKTETVSEAVLSDVCGPLLALFGLMLAGVGVLIWRWQAFPGDHEVLRIVGAWLLFNTALVAAALRAVVEQRQRRGAPRAQVALPAMIVPHGARMAAAVDTDTSAMQSDFDGHAVGVADVSYTGARLVIMPTPGTAPQRTFAEGDWLRLLPPSPDGTPGTAAQGGVIARVVGLRRQAGRITLGIAFAPEQTAAGFRDIAVMLHGNSELWQAWRDRRAQPIGLTRGFARLVGYSGKGLGAVAVHLTRGKRRNAPQPDTLPTAWSAHPDMAEYASMRPFHTAPTHAPAAQQ